MRTLSPSPMELGLRYLPCQASRTVVLIALESRQSQGPVAVDVVAKHPPIRSVTQLN